MFSFATHPPSPLASMPHGVHCPPRERLFSQSWPCHLQAVSNTGPLVLAYLGKVPVRPGLSPVSQEGSKTEVAERVAASPEPEPSNSEQRPAAAQPCAPPSPPPPPLEEDWQLEAKELLQLNVYLQQVEPSPKKTIAPIPKSTMKAAKKASSTPIVPPAKTRPSKATMPIMPLSTKAHFMQLRLDSCQPKLCSPVAPPPLQKSASYQATVQSSHKLKPPPARPQDRGCSARGHSLPRGGSEVPRSRVVGEANKTVPAVSLEIINNHSRTTKGGSREYRGRSRRNRSHSRRRRRSRSRSIVNSCRYDRGDRRRRDSRGRSSWRSKR